jgi:hypothetical protein
MPQLFRINGWVIKMFADETEQPHFHVFRSGEEFRFSLADYSQLETDIATAPSGLPRKMREWASRNQQALIDAWAAIQNGCIPDKSRFIS